MAGSSFRRSASFISHIDPRCVHAVSRQQPEVNWHDCYIYSNISPCYNKVTGSFSRLRGATALTSGTGSNGIDARTACEGFESAFAAESGAQSRAGAATRSLSLTVFRNLSCVDRLRSPSPLTARYSYLCRNGPHLL